MPVFDPRLLSDWTGGDWRGPPPGRICGFGIDSRVLRPGQFFVAIRTPSRDGHAYVGAAGRAGASGALVGHFDPEAGLAQLVVEDPVRALQGIARMHRARFPGPVIGITGSCGKTSTKDLLTHALGDRSAVWATEGNLNNALGLPLSLLGCDPDLHRHAVIEAGISEPGEMNQLAAILNPDVALLTSIGAAHLQALGSVEAVACEKARLFEHLRPGGRVFLPVDCLQWSVFRALAGPRTIVAPASVCRPDAGDGGQSAVTFETFPEVSSLRVLVRFPGGRPVEFRLRSTSLGMVSNAVLALAAAVELGRDPSEAARRLEDWRPASLRGEIMECSGRLIYLDCYNANLVSMLDAVRAFVERVDASTPRLFLIGSMEELGERSADLHESVGREWPKGLQDRFVLIGDRSPDLYRGLIAAGHPPSAITMNPPDHELASLVEDWEGAVFIKGSRRHRLEKCIGPATVPAIGREAAC